MGPHKRLAAGSILLVLGAYTLAILMPVVVTRVVIDGPWVKMSLIGRWPPLRAGRYRRRRGAAVNR